MKRKIAIFMALLAVFGHGTAVAACFKCGGTGKCGYCEDGYVYVGTLSRLCNVCNATGICHICNGTGR